MKKTLLCDLDEVVVNLMDSWLAMYHELGGELKTRADIRNYNMDGQFADMSLFWKAIDRAPSMRVAKPFPGAIAALRELHGHYNLYLVTYARHESWGRAHEAKLAWLWQHAPWLNRDRVIFVREKSMILGHILIEDNVENCEKWLAANPHGEAYLVTQNWNKNYKVCHPRMLRVKDLADAAQALEWSRPI